ncbi:Histone acetyltransferase HPA2 [Moritella sp. JT01]|uniref:GNAT family N-acetyltransferase n=1 Tax=Moritella sp. JT01 TaxID=756698 RepID=UPI0007956DB4|nr:GNAT family N-acetyltransferase [Moritella sp. JT01]KXO10888.1 Histone acetyltransferase HPA2 [Moritella sp. JT01]
MSCNITVRDGSRTDAKAIQAIASPIMKSFGLEPDFDDLDYELGHFGENYPGSIVQLVACLNDAVIGSVILKAHKENVAKLTGFYISEKQQGKGIGKKLLNVAIQRAKLLGHESIYLETWDKMESATNLYQKLGWEKTIDPDPKSGAERAYILNLKS